MDVKPLDPATEAAFSEILAQRQVRRGMFIIRLATVDIQDPFHRDLAQTLAACDPGALDGDLITAMRFTIDHAMLEAGTEADQCKTRAERMLSVGAAEVMMETRLSRAAAERAMKDTPEYWDLRETAGRLGQRRSYFSELLKSLQAALDNHRTSRADQRAADTWHAQTGT